jgi:hypothetical protein
MSGDYSRIRFDPRTDIASVWMQQGRVQLDSDWNEGMAALDRRLRAESVDTFGVQPVPGMTGVAVVSPQTPDAFKIEAAGGDMTIGRGRMYVDGLLAENHGGGAAEFDAVLAELRGQTALAYDQQPYFSAPPALPGGGPHLVYLEVWSRELTYLQRPEIVENAVGVDTTTRWQTVWQVRLLGNIGSVDCTTPDAQFPAWQALTRPSGGRLSIKAEGVPPDLDPCELPPSGGYRGLENQLYRIEIHDGGAVGAATFKWSRDNASVASPVVEIVSQTAASTELKLASLGRDAVLRFNTGDWVEILDDRRELNGENGDPALRRGVMRQITVDNARQTIQFSPALPADLIPAGDDDTLAARHTRVRRWDQKGATVDSTNGLIKVPSAENWVELEKGIQVRFSLDPAGGEFRSGDYWVSAARTVDTSIETFTDAPPRGIHRHYARLAIADFHENGPVVSDCRTHWPPACGGCCTITVAPGESIQAAINSLPLAGGCVCLKTGVHIIDEPIRITKSHIILQGESPGVVVYLEKSESSHYLLGIGNNTINDDDKVSNIVVHRIRFEAAQSPVGALLIAANCMELQVTHCEFSNVVGTLDINYGIWLGGVNNATIASNRIQNVMTGILLLKCDGYIDTRDNFIEGVVEENSEEGLVSRGASGIFTEGEGKSGQVICHIENNIIRHFKVGISLDRYAAGSVVIGNHIYYGAFDLKPELIDGEHNFENLTVKLDELSYVIDIAAADCEVRRNVIDLGGKGIEGIEGDKSSANESGGIRIRASGVTVASNRLRNQHPQLPSPVGIYCLDDKVVGYAADQVTISDNHLLEFQIGIIISGVDNATVSSNFIRGGWLHPYGVILHDCDHSCVRDNTLQDLRGFALLSYSGGRNHLRGNRISEASIGVGLIDESDPEISGNHLYSCGTGMWLSGIRGAVNLKNNRLMNCGGFRLLGLLEEFDPSHLHEEDPVGYSIYVFSLASSIHIDGCEVIDTGVTANGDFRGMRAWGIGIAGSLTALQVTNNRIDYTNITNSTDRLDSSALQFNGITESTLINSNYFRGFGKMMPLVEFRDLDSRSSVFFGNMTFSNNTCSHFLSKSDRPGVTVSLSSIISMRFIIMGNQILSSGVPLFLYKDENDDKNSVAICVGNTMRGYLKVRVDVAPAEPLFEALNIIN